MYVTVFVIFSCECIFYLRFGAEIGCTCVTLLVLTDIFHFRELFWLPAKKLARLIGDVDDRDIATMAD